FGAGALDLLLKIRDRAVELPLLHPAAGLAPSLVHLSDELTVLVDEILHRERQLIDAPVEDLDVRPKVRDFDAVVVGLLDFRARRSREIGGLSERVLADGGDRADGKKREEKIRPHLSPSSQSP